MKVWSFLAQRYQPISDRNWLGFQTLQINFGSDEFRTQIQGMTVRACVYVEPLLQQYQGLLKTSWFLADVIYNNNLTFSLASYPSVLTHYFIYIAFKQF